MAAVFYNHEDIQDFRLISTVVHNAIKPVSLESKNGRVSDGTAGGGDISMPFSGTVTMTPRPGRSPNMKLEKRASMSQLLAQLKDRLPGRKNKGQKRLSKKDLAGTENSEPLLWNNNGKWKERWYALCEGCLIFYKDPAYRSPDFALDVRSCRLEIPAENQEQGFLSFTLLEIDGKSHEIAMVTEESYTILISNLRKMKHPQGPKDSGNGLLPGNEDSDSMALDDAIIPYSESESYAQVPAVEAKTKREKHASVDSGTDGDISCFEGSDASTAGIGQYASDRKDKVIARRRKTSLVLPQPVIITDPEMNTEDSAREHAKGRVASVRGSHRKVVHCESSPPSPRSPVPSKTEALAKATKAILRPIEYLNVEDQRLPRSRYSMPVFPQKHVLTNEEFNRQRRSCLEELIKLKETHDLNQYPEKDGKVSKQRTTSLRYSYGRSSAVLDENDNYADIASFEKMTGSYPKRSSSFKTNASPSPSARSTASAKQRHVSMMASKGLSKSMILPTEGRDSYEVLDESQDDLQQQTLLMKRRNSLKLQKDNIDRKVKALRSRVGRSSTEGTDTDTAEEEQNVSLLENKLRDIEKELSFINEIADMPPEDVFKEGKKKTRQQLFSKFKSSQKTPQSSHKGIIQRDTSDNAVTNPSLSPAVRKRSLSHNFKLFGGPKRNSDQSELNSNRASTSSLDSSNDGLFVVNDSYTKSGAVFTDLKGPDDYKLDSVRTRKTSSVDSELDELDGPVAKESSTENGISKDALLKIEEFEQFAVEITAKRFTDYVDV